MNDEPLAKEPLVRNISDTALWVAVYRANETERPNAAFKDPYARVLAGERGARIAQAMELRKHREWPFIARTVLFDRMILQSLAGGVDTVLNLAAGLDARPYRMDLPPQLRWIEADLPDMINYKERHLEDAIPRCKLERERVDLADGKARRELFERVDAESRKVLIITEGLTPYFAESEVATFARDLSDFPSFKRWLTDLMSPRVLQMIGKSVGPALSRASAMLKFAPENGVAFFEPFGWKAVQVHSYMTEAAKLKRLPWLLRLAAKIPVDVRHPGRKPWSAAVMLENTNA